MLVHSKTFQEPRRFELKTGDRILFSTRFYPQTVGLVLDIDHAAKYGVKLQFENAAGDRRIVPFQAGEFLTLNTEN